MKLTNLQITNYAQALNSAFTDPKLYLPVRINFNIQKNAQALALLAKEIEESRIQILSHYGETGPDGNITVPENKQAEAIVEIQDLYSIEQDVNILMVNINTFGDLSLSLEQMNAIMFMIEED